MRPSDWLRTVFATPPARRVVHHPAETRRSRCPGSRRLLAGIAFASLGAVPHIAPAQSLRGFLRGVERATRSGSALRDTTAHGASGGAVHVVEQHVDGSDSLAQRFALDTGLTAFAAPCGATRACVPGWDLRVLRVALPGPIVPTGARVVVTTEVENRGRQPAPASELRICFSVRDPLGVPERPACGRRMLDAVALPALAAGQHVVVRHAIELPIKDREAAHWTIDADIDPDNTLGERDRSNNGGRSAETSSRLPTFQILTLDLPADPRPGAPFPVTLAVRNTSTAASSPAVDLQLEGSRFCGGASGAEWGGGPNRVAVPALAPRQTVTYRLLVPDATRCRVSGATFVVRIDPDHRGAWGQGHEGQIRRTYTVR